MFLPGRSLTGEQEGLPETPSRFENRWRFLDGNLIVPIRTTAGQAVFKAGRRTRRRIVPFLLSGVYGDKSYSSRIRALVLVNPGPREAQIVLEILGPDTDRMEELFTIAPLAQLIWIPEASELTLPERGVINIRSDFPIGVLALSLADDLVTRIQGN